MRSLKSEELQQVFGGTLVDDPCKEKGNNGFAYGHDGDPDAKIGEGGDPAPGNSGLNSAPSAGEKLEDIVR